MKQKSDLTSDVEIKKAYNQEQKEKFRKVGKRSKNKGKRRELEFAHFLQERGCPSARRTQQFNGKGESDVVCEELPFIHIEVKGEEKLNVHKAMDQAILECGSLIPIVAHKKSNKEWLVYMRGEDWVKMALKAGNDRLS